MITKEQFVELLKDGGKYVRVRPEDSLRLCHSLEYTIEQYDADYRDHIIGFRKAEDWNNYEPVFDAATQAKWDAALEKYVEHKARWCAENTCD